jgi:hypothetical protein
MRSWSRTLLFCLAISIIGCATREPASPRQTFETYIRAMKQKDYSAMKVLLSSGTMKMHEQEAKAQGVTVDEIIKRESLLSQNQKTIEYRDEKIDGDKATLQYKNAYSSWETMPFVREDGVWKIDKQGYAQQLNDEFDKRGQQINDMINGNRAVPAPTAY